MAQIKRKEVTVYAHSWEFEDKFEKQMKQFEDKDVINIHVLKSEEKTDYKNEVYIVFYKEEQ